MQHDLASPSDDAAGSSAALDTTPAPVPTPALPTRRSAGSKRRSLIKTLSWRVTATTTTFLIAWFVTGDLGAGAAIGGVEAVAKMFLYYGHERAWERVPVT